MKFNSFGAMVVEGSSWLALTVSVLIVGRWQVCDCGSILRIGLSGVEKGRVKGIERIGAKAKICVVEALG